MELTMFVGMDVHKRTKSVAIAKPGRGGEVRFLAEIPSTPEALHRVVLRLKSRHRHLRLCYEAGPCGYGVHRTLGALGQTCIVVAPSLIPSRPGDRVKTNRRDTTTLAKLHRRADGGVGSGCGARGDARPGAGPATARRLLAKARQHLLGFLLRHGRIYRGVLGWSAGARRTAAAQVRADQGARGAGRQGHPRHPRQLCGSRS